jgi:hypothetical protein
MRRLGGTACSFKKGSLGRDMPSVGMLVGLLLALTWQAASDLLELSSSTLSSWRGLCRQPDWAPHRLGDRALAPWALSGSLQGHEPNSAASGTLGSSERFFCRQWLACSNMLVCPWWSLEGLLAAAQNWPIFYKKVLDKNPQLVGILVCHEGTSEVQNKMIIMGHQISSCHVPVVRSFFIL